MPAPENSRPRKFRFAVKTLVLLVLLYAALAIPERPAPPPQGAGKQPFVWNRNEFWSALESQFRAARNENPAARSASPGGKFDRIQSTLDALATTSLPPAAPIFSELESNLFELAPQVAASPEHFTNFLQACLALRNTVKRQSEAWPMNVAGSRERLYRLLYGSRAALEEVMLQLRAEQIPAMTRGGDVPSATPSASVHGVTVHSGDILLSRGGAATSALIARGNDFPGNFSHVALVHVDEQTQTVSVIESHIECGVVVSPVEKYLADTKLRIMVLRLRPDLPAMLADPQLPHKAASLALREATTRHIPYDFAMDYADPAKQFCSEVAAAAYKPCGLTLWMGLSHLSTPGLTAWLSALGVRHFETQEPSDLEYDPQLRVVAEWRDPETLFKDHADNAVIDVLLEGAERGDRLDYDLYRLPLARLAKGWSVVKNWFGGVGPIPEGMTAATALRVQKLKTVHAAVKARVLSGAEKFKAEKGYAPPYWELVRLAREARDQSR